MLRSLVAPTIFLVVLILSILDLPSRRKVLRNHNLTEKQARKLDARGVWGYLNRFTDLVFWVLLVVLAYASILRFSTGACPWRNAFLDMIYLACLSIIPIGAGYIWTLLPPGRKGSVEADLAKVGLQEKTRLARIHLLLMRPFIGLCYIAYLLTAGLLIYFSFK